MTFTVIFTNGSTAEVYGGLDACDDHLFQSGSSGAAAYNELAVDSDDRKRLLVDATRYIDRRRWKGTRNGAGGTALAFPRDDLTEVEGDPPATASDGYQLARVSQAVFELVALAAEDPSIFAEADAGSNIRRMKAGSAELELFSPTSARTGTASTLPTAVQDLLGLWLLGGGPIVAVSASGTSTGTCDTSIFGCTNGFDRGEAF